MESAKHSLDICISSGAGCFVMIGSFDSSVVTRYGSSLLTIAVIAMGLMLCMILILFWKWFFELGLCFALTVDCFDAFVVTGVVVDFDF